MEVEGVLDDLLPALQQAALPSNLRLDPPLEEAEAVHVLELGLGAELVGALRPDRDIRVDTKRPLLHVHVGDAELADRRPEKLGPLPRLAWRADVGLGNDLNQRSPAPVEVDEGGAGAVDPTGLTDVDHLRRVLLQMGAVNPDVAQATVHRKRFVVLADLVAL